MIEPHSFLPRSRNPARASSRLSPLAAPVPTDVEFLLGVGVVFGGGRPVCPSIQKNAKTWRSRSRNSCESCWRRIGRMGGNVLDRDLEFDHSDAEKFILGALAYNKAVERLSPEKGYVFDAENIDAVLPAETVLYQDKKREAAASLYHIWIVQRAQGAFAVLGDDDKACVLEMLGAGLAADLVPVPLTTRVERVNNRIVVAGWGEDIQAVFEQNVRVLA